MEVMDGVAGAAHLDDLNSAQRAAAVFGIHEGERCSGTPPLLIIAGAGSGKTKTLTHRVAHLVLNGADPRRILLLTFARRMAAEMTRRVEHICANALKGRNAMPPESFEWSGTFHAMGAKILRLHAQSGNLDPSFSILDRSDAQDLIDLMREELGLAETKTRFPKKSTCLAIYSYTVNAQANLRATLLGAFPWCVDWEEALRNLFRAYVDAKQAQGMLDYDDLLLYWAQLMQAPEAAASIAGRFDHVLVDEYQDTNALQAAILFGLKPGGQGLTVVGDDAQSIYSFRSATIRNILDFAAQCNPSATTLKLEQNYRSTQPILDACNRVIGHTTEGIQKTLYSKRANGGKPALAMVSDESAQVDAIIERVLANREAGMELREQAVLMRASHHSGQLELELSRRNIPFVKFGGLKFIEAGHIKDVLAIMRWAEHPRDQVSGMRVMKLLPGIGPVHARSACALLSGAVEGFDFLVPFKVPAAARGTWEGLLELMNELASSKTWTADLERIRRWYDPLLQDRYDSVHTRKGDLDQLERIAALHPSRSAFLAELALDPPQAVGAQAGPPVKDEDWLVLSTIHSAKGQEWKAVYVLNVVDGCIPSDLATGTPEEIEEERRLLYVAMTRAKDYLMLAQPMKFYVRGQASGSDRHVYAPRSRFVMDEDLDAFDLVRIKPAVAATAPQTMQPTIDLKAAIRKMWG